jgi:aerobic-type carbon monoxide dehydrogenase small subunit (CoxS/CutS family)
VRLIVTGTDVEIDNRYVTTPLLGHLRDVLGLPGTKFGCGVGFGAACTVASKGSEP